MSLQSIESFVSIFGPLIGTGGISAIISHYITIRIQNKQRASELSSIRETMSSELTSSILNTAEERTRYIVDLMQKQIDNLTSNQQILILKVEEQEKELNIKRQQISDLEHSVERLVACQKTNPECPFSRFIENSNPEAEAEVSGLLKLGKKKDSEVRSNIRRRGSSQSKTS